MIDGTSGAMKSRVGTSRRSTIIVGKSSVATCNSGMIGGGITYEGMSEGRKSDNSYYTRFSV